MKKLLPFYLLFALTGLLIQEGEAQYDPDRHNTSYNAGWISCETRESPNTARGSSFWIMYDLGQIYKLGKVHLWNTNVPGFEGIGIKDYLIDYSVDGNVWQTWGQETATIVTPSGYYTGNEGPDLNGLEARFLLITAVSNHGGDCVGFSEIRIQTEGLATDVFEVGELEGKITAQPSIFAENTVILLEDILPGEYQYTLTGLSGNVVSHNKINIIQEKEQIPLNGNNLPQGMYVFTISDGVNLKSIKIEKIDP